jgi:PAS domain S-box-containing protein
MSLSNKFVLAILSIVFVMVSLFTYNEINDQKELLDNELNKRISLMKDNLRQNASYNIKYYKHEVENDLAAMNLSHINILFKRLVRREDIEGVSIISNNENIHIFAGMGLKKDVNELTFEEWKNHISVSMPLSLSEKWGTITIVYSLKKLNDELQKTQEDFEKLISKNITSAIITALIIAFIFSILSYIWSRKLTAPILLLTKTAQKIAKGELEDNKQLSYIKSDDEVGDLAKAFLIMSKELDKSYKDLKHLNETLEKQVQKRTKKIESERNKFKTFLDGTMEGILISNDNVCTDLNESAFRIFGYDSKEELIGKRLIDFIAEESKEQVKKNLTLNRTMPYETVALKKDGTKFPAYVRGINVKDENIRVSSILDISHLKQLESHKKLASMGEMIGNIAHQWRQPLSVISTAASGIQIKHEHGSLNDEELDYMCTQINENTQYLSQTIDDFKNFIKGDSKPVKFNIEDDTQSFIKLVNTTIKKYNIQLILDIQENIEITGYPNELIQCFINIFNNSKDAFLENGIKEEERYFFITQKCEGNNIIISFKDNACGIPENILPKIFEPYFSTKHQSQGTGLGLHMSYKLVVDHMKGEIEVVNEEYKYNGKKYKGAKFTITIPVT